MKLFIFFLFFALLLPLSPVRADVGECFCLFNDNTYDQLAGNSYTEVGDCELGCQALVDDDPEAEAEFDRPLYDDGSVDFQTPAELGMSEREGGLAAGIAAAEDRRAEIEARAEAFAAAGQCQCYCGVEDVGAQVLDGTYKQDGECKAACTAAGKEFVTCASSGAETPLANPLCWSESECATKLGTWDENFQPTECEPSRRYCYPAATAVDLNVDIGPIDEISDIGSYINAIYTYGLGAAAIVAVVLIMIGGAQYMIGSGIGSVEAGRKRITNAVTGLVILLGAYLLLATVNPYLVNWQTLRVPKLKPTLFVNNNCEAYETLGYIVDPVEVSSVDAGTYCGDAGIVSSSPDGVSMSADCIYDSCRQTSADDSCVAQGDGYACLTCEMANDDAVEAGFNATAGSCGGLSSTTGATINKCVFIPANVVLRLASIGRGDTCAPVQIDCASITTCAKYESLQARVPNSDGSVYINSLSVDFDGVLEAICTDNPCKEQITDDPCYYYEPSGLEGTFVAPYRCQNQPEE